MISKALRVTRILLFIVLDFFAGRVFNAKNTALLLVRVDNIGDFVLWLPLARRLAQHYSSSTKPALICNQACVELAVATRWFDIVIGIDPERFTRDFIYRWRKVQKVARLGSSVVIQPTFSRVFLTGDSLVRASRAVRRIGSVGDYSNIKPWQKAISDSWYTQLVSASSFSMMELHRNNEFLRNLGLVAAEVEIPSIPKLIDLPLDKTINGDYFVIFPGASSPVRQWPAASFVSLANLISEKYGFIPVVCGGPSDQQFCASVVRGVEVNAFDFSAKTSLPELIEVIRGARLVVTNETSATHIAASVQTPTVCVLGGGHYGRFMPYSDDIKGLKPVPVIKEMDCYGCNWVCIFSKDQTRAYPCIERVEIHKVFEAVSFAITHSQVRHYVNY